MIQVCESLASPLSAGVGGYQLVVGGVDLHHLSTTPDPQLLSNQTKGGRVVGVVEDQVAVPVQFDLFPHSQVVGSTWQRL
jgi:hypothetical protein